MNIVCFPIAERGPAELAEILRGGADQLAGAGVALVGGHSVEDSEPKYGLSVTGTVDPAHIATNAGARPGDSIVLTKPLGTGIVTTAAKFDECDEESFRQACASMALLNRPASEAMQEIGIGPDLPVHSVTDITGFGLLGHLFHLARASGVGIEIDGAGVPLFPEVCRMAAAGNVTRGGKENADYLSKNLIVSDRVPSELLSALVDPQTSGGLAICIDSGSVSSLLDRLSAHGVETQAVIGKVTASSTPMIEIR